MISIFLILILVTKANDLIMMIIFTVYKYIIKLTLFKDCCPAISLLQSSERGTNTKLHERGSMWHVKLHNLILFAVVI